MVAKSLSVSTQSLGHFMRGNDYKLGAVKREKLVAHLSETSGQRWTLAKLNKARQRLAAIHPIKENLV